MPKLHDVILRPLQTEKSNALIALANRYSFEVASQAHKLEIKEAVSRLFKVQVLDVRTQRMHGKVKRVGRQQVKRSNWKKALVTLAPGQKIELFKQAK